MSRRYSKHISIFLLFCILNQICFPTLSWALTSGPGQPEIAGFEPASTSDMVDLFTGDFHYSIPLFDLEGYPVNLSYQSGIGMDDEASWVGLGWSLNPGVVNRDMRGIPDDFQGDLITRQFNLKDNYTIGLNAGISSEIASLPIKFGLNAGLFYNNYKGFGIEAGISPTLSISKTNKTMTSALGPAAATDSTTLSAGVSLNYNSQNGFDIGTSLSFEKHVDNISYKDMGISFGGFNSREGLKELNFTASIGRKPSDGELKKMRLSGGVSFGTSAYTPVPKLPLLNESVSLKATLGPEFAPLHPNTSFRGYYSRQYLAYKKISQPAFGYLKSSYGKNNQEALLDFNKEQGINAYTNRMKKLPISYGTYDLFSVIGQGVAGQFRAMRGDVGVFREPQSNNSSTGINLGAELGFGNVVHTGFDVNIPTSNATGGAWLDDNGFKDKVNFTFLQSAALYEPVYFKNSGESTPLNLNYYQLIGEEAPSYVDLKKVGTNISSTRDLVQEKNMVYLGRKTYNSNVQKVDRDKRNQVFSYLNGYDAEFFGLEKKIYSYHKDSLPSINCSSNVKTEYSRLDYPWHHISEVTVTQPGGGRYVYGIPVYNLTQKEVTFSVNKLSTDTCLVTYTDNQNSTGNNTGRDGYYDAKTIPSYATSFLLTGVLSPDYVDFTGDGITDDDAGSGVKFNYTKISGKYKWRYPSNGSAKVARYNPGLKADAKDDKGSYVYGERELWYLHSVVSKNFIAKFYTSPRKDGLGIKEDGTIDISGPKSHRLDSIKVFSKTELLTNPQSPTPIKSVYFVYEETQGNGLCPGVPNHEVNGGGKLTLTAVYFTYRKNRRGSFNQYKFEYVKKDVNNITYNYGIQNVDRWGTYKRRTNIAPGKLFPNNMDFPYTYQHDSIATNAYASAWHLNKIKLPTGGTVDVHYESDDYAYVQDKRSGQTVFIKGFSNVNNTTIFGTTSNLFAQDTNYYMYLHLPFAVSSVSEFQKRYLEGVDQLYFNCLVNLTGVASAYEYIQGYASYYKNSIALVPPSSGGKFNTVAIKLVPVRGDRGTWLNPITKTALQTLRLSLPDLAYGVQPPSSGQPILKQIKGLIPILQDVGDLILGFDKTRTGQGYAKVADCDYRSWARLCNPTLKKYGGGSRVKKITIGDNWSSMAANGHNSSAYGQEYLYTTVKSVNGRDTLVSSGVASYEPILGNDENLLREPLNYQNKQVLLGPKTYLYQEKPVGEALYPASVVGYSQVTVRNISHANVKRTATGYSIYRYYTAKEFPVKSEYTKLHFKEDKGNILSRILKIHSKDNLTLSQGFTIEVNDMHGKPKSEEVYDEAGALISSIEYRYRMDNQNGTTLQLKNNLDVVKPDGTIINGTIGIDVDIWQEMSQEEVNTEGLGVAAGLDVGFSLGFIPIPFLFPNALPIYHKEQSRVRASVTTKFIKRFGILEKVIKTENGSSLASENILWDSETGEPLLTKMQNEFDEPVYKFDYPAHWMYDGLGQAYKNQDALFTNVKITNGKIINLPNIGTLLNHGDEVIVYRRKTFGPPVLLTSWVNKIGSDYYLIDRGGTLVVQTFNGTSTVGLKIKRSARRNMASAVTGTVESLGNPRTGNTINYSNATKVITASANTYSDTWQAPRIRKVSTCGEHSTNNSDLFLLIQKLCIKDSLWYVKPAQNKTACDVVDLNPCSTPFLTNNLPANQQKFYSLQDKPAYGLLESYKAKIGDCVLTILDTVNYSPFKPESIQCTIQGSSITLTYNNTNLVYIFDCLPCSEFCSTTPQPINTTVNPFFLGLKGNWRSSTTYAFDNKNTRDYSASTINQKGYYSTFTPFWQYASNIWSATPGTDWVRANSMTKYDRAGNEVENVDALYKYSAALFGFKNQKPLATSTNCQYTQIAYEGFEDKGVTGSTCTNPCQEIHFPYSLSTTGVVSSAKAHTGKFSMKLTGTDSLYYEITKAIPATNEIITLAPDNKTWRLGPNGGIGTFQPIGNTDRKYVVSAWVYMDQFLCDDFSSVPQIKVSLPGAPSSPSPFPVEATTPSIEGWRKIEFEVVIPSSATSIRIKIWNPTGTGGDVYVDDIRIHPFDGSMRSFAYDPYSLRLMAELDERNYATFYEYDDAGLLIRVKKETERGVMTIKEGRTYMAPNN